MLTMLQKIDVAWTLADTNCLECRINSWIKFYLFDRLQRKWLSVLRSQKLKFNHLFWRTRKTGVPGEKLWESNLSPRIQSLVAEVELRMMTTALTWPQSVETISSFHIKWVRNFKNKNMKFGISKCPCNIEEKHLFYSCVEVIKYMSFLCVWAWNERVVLAREDENLRLRKV